jgi:hypothetical protein
MSSGRAYIRAGEFFFLGSMSRDSEPIQLNSNIAVTCEILKVVPASMAEAKLGTLLVNRKKNQESSALLKSTSAIFNRQHRCTLTTQQQ